MIESTCCNGKPKPVKEKKPKKQKPKKPDPAEAKDGKGGKDAVKGGKPSPFQVRISFTLFFLTISSL